jgi:hypothetical protein
MGYCRAIREGVSKGEEDGRIFRESVDTPSCTGLGIGVSKDFKQAVRRLHVASLAGSNP